MILEIRILNLRPDADVNKSVASAYDVVHSSCVNTLTREGARYAYFGRSSEQPATMCIFIGWDNLENSNEFASSLDAENPFSGLRDLASIEEDMAVLHVPFEPSQDPSPALGADRRVKVTELVLYYFPSPLTGKAAIMDSMDKMRPVIGRSEALSVHDGGALKDKENEKGEKSMVYVNVVGWADVDAHMRFQASEDFKENIHHLLDIKSIQKMEMHHVQLHRV